jgi:hypothetical protein
MEKHSAYSTHMPPRTCSRIKKGPKKLKTQGKNVLLLPEKRRFWPTGPMQFLSMGLQYTEEFQ